MEPKIKENPICKECWKYDRKPVVCHVVATFYDYYFHPHSYVGYLCEEHLEIFQKNGVLIQKLKMLKEEEYGNQKGR